MKLLFASVEGYGRFYDKATVRIDERVIAVVGPNEAGKSTLLRALTRLEDDEPWKPGEATRGSLLEGPEISATFALEDEDESRLCEEIPGIDLRQFTIVKGPSGQRSYILDPYPRRSREPRRKTLAALRDHLATMDTAHLVDESIDGIRVTAEALDTDAESLEPSVIDFIIQLREAILSSPAIESWSLLDDSSRSALGKLLSEFLEVEQPPAPASRAGQILRARRPMFLLFDEADRSLATSYNLHPLESMPKALNNLGDVAELDLASLRRAGLEHDQPKLESLIDAANEKLKQKFRGSWRQSDLTVRLRVDGEVLYILVSLPSGPGYSSLEERSDGLRWFVALSAFLAVAESPTTPTLLIDEAESHLHYDAQADLMQLMSTQRLAGCIIYTTHSAGCLPPDLGTGIRVVVPEGDFSRTKNTFWDPAPGVSALMSAMGAGVFAFAALRRAVLVEGPSDATLLPTLLRQSSGADQLGYQIVPGISAFRDTKELEMQAACVAFLLDGDDAGAKRKEWLIEAGIERSRILTLSEFTAAGTVLEDLVAQDAYLAAVNYELRTRQRAAEKIGLTDQLPTVGRPTWVEDWCHQHALDPPSKVCVANQILGARETGSQFSRVVASRRARATAPSFTGAPVPR